MLRLLWRQGMQLRLLPGWQGSSELVAAGWQGPAQEPRYQGPLELRQLARALARALLYVASLTSPAGGGCDTDSSSLGSTLPFPSSLFVFSLSVYFF